jgi:hypothetical protein
MSLNLTKIRLRHYNAVHVKFTLPSSMLNKISVFEALKHLTQAKFRLFSRRIAAVSGVFVTCSIFLNSVKLSKLPNNKAIGNYATAQGSSGRIFHGLVANRSS